MTTSAGVGPAAVTGFRLQPGSSSEPARKKTIALRRKIRNADLLNILLSFNLNAGLSVFQGTILKGHSIPLKRIPPFPQIYILRSLRVSGFDFARGGIHMAHDCR